VGQQPAEKSVHHAAYRSQVSGSLCPAMTTVSDKSSSCPFIYRKDGNPSMYNKLQIEDIACNSIFWLTQTWQQHVQPFAIDIYRWKYNPLQCSVSLNRTGLFTMGFWSPISWDMGVSDLSWGYPKRALDGDFFMENPNKKRMKTRGTPMTQETSISAKKRSYNWKCTKPRSHPRFQDQLPRRNVANALAV